MGRWELRQEAALDLIRIANTNTVEIQIIVATRGEIRGGNGKPQA